MFKICKPAIYFYRKKYCITIFSNEGNTSYNKGCSNVRINVKQLLPIVSLTFGSFNIQLILIFTTKGFLLKKFIILLKKISNAALTLNVKACFCLAIILKYYFCALISFNGIPDHVLITLLYHHQI